MPKLTEAQKLNELRAAVGAILKAHDEGTCDDGKSYYPSEYCNEVVPEILRLKTVFGEIDD